MYKLPERRGGGGEEIWGRPERKHSFLNEVFPKVGCCYITPRQPEDLTRGNEVLRNKKLIYFLRLLCRLISRKKRCTKKIGTMSYYRKCQFSFVKCSV